jgi:glycine C-acetyltransferase
MSITKLNEVLSNNVADLKLKGTAKGCEMVITGIKHPSSGNGPRYLVDGYGNKEFIKMNSNSYLGLTLHPKMIAAEEKSAQEFGTGPGAVRFISGTHRQHIELEERLAKFHNRESAMIFSSAYVTSLGVLFPLCTKKTVFISDALNHNCIIQAMRLSRPAGKAVYKHNDMKDLEVQIQSWIGKADRVLAVTDGIFSMRGDNAPLKEFVDICEKYSHEFNEGIITIADDSHGAGGFGHTGRGTEEYCNTKVDILIGTLGKAFGVNGGYVTSSKAITDYLRETAPMYIYSNPITVSEASASKQAIDILDSSEGIKILSHLRKMTKRFDNGLTQNGFETIKGDHPVVPLMVRDTQKTAELVNYLTDNGVLATGLNFPVVPKGDEEIRFQVNADHTEKDIDTVIGILKRYQQN